MKEIILKSDKIRITKINKKTTVKIFSELVVGDELLLTIPIKHAGSAHIKYGGTRANYITVEVVKTKEKTQKSFNELSNILASFEFEVAGDTKYINDINDYTEKIQQECTHKKKDGTSAVEYCSTYEMRSNDMYCTLCGKNGSRKELT